MYSKYKKFLSFLKDTKKFRELQDISNLNPIKSNLLDFSTNDYLLLSKNEDLLKAGIKSGNEYGVGATGSRLLSGNREIFNLLENSIAKKKNTESALYFSSGFLANFTTLSSLIDKKVLEQKPIVFFDRLNHASLYQAIFLNNPELIRYEHNNMDQLSDLLKKYTKDSRPKYIVTETVFGMDGDIAPLSIIVKLAKEHSAFLYLDEAHATGIFGKDGYGLSTYENFKGVPNVIMGTFSKALGCSGGYIACSNIMKEYFINKSSGFIYSTAISPIVAGIAKKAWEIIGDLKIQRESLLNLATYTRNKLKKLGFDIGNSATHIIPIILKTEELTLKVKELLLKENIIVSAIRPPTVPPATSRIRIALTVGHTQNDIDRLIEVLQKI